MPKEYQDALREFAEKKSTIQKMMSDDWQKAAEMLAELSINKLTRQSPSEFIYDMIAYLKSNKERLMENMYTWTMRRSSGGRLVCVGSLDSDGAGVLSRRPDGSSGSLGVSFSRSL